MKIRMLAALLVALLSLSLLTGCAPGDQEAQPTEKQQLAQLPVGALTAYEAEDIAYTHAKAEPTEVTRLHTELDYDDGIYKYEIEFTYGGNEYEYKVNAETGAILHSKIEAEPSGNGITAEQAQQIALEHASLTKEQVTGLKATFDYDDGVPEYDVDFYYNGVEYDYEIHGQTGAILRWEKDAEPTSAPQQPVTNEKLTAEQAKEIALQHAGLTAGQVSHLKAEYDVDDGVPEYDVEFRYGNWEYEYEIHAQTGKVLFWDKELDD